jgi:nicotinamidase-related amidase
MNNQKTSLRLNRAQSGLVVVDIQERLLPAIFEKDKLIEASLRLIKGAAILGIPIFTTEQYRKGLGATAPEVAAAITGFAPLEKVTFSACGAEGFSDALKSKKITNVILCGMEAHVCVLQTCLDLLDNGLRVFVVADAISARDPQNSRLALQRMHDAGAVIASTEMVLFELLGRARTEEFKQVQALVK